MGELLQRAEIEDAEPRQFAATAPRARSIISRSRHAETLRWPCASSGFHTHVVHEIQRAAREGLYDIRGLGAKRPLPDFDDLVFLGACMSRYPLEGYRERCLTNTVLGTRHAKQPIELEIPITVAGMSFGALSAPAKEAIGRAATAWARRRRPVTAA